MSDERTQSRGGLLARVPSWVQIGLAVLSFAFAAAILTDTIEDPIPNDVWAVVWFAVAIGLLVRTVRLYRRS